MDYKSSLRHYLDTLIKNYDTTICIKDFNGFICSNHVLYDILSPYMEHTTPYCSIVKSDPKGLRECHNMVPKIFKQANTQKTTFCGKCHAGVLEYIVPIICNNIVVGAITFGCFRTKEEDKCKNFHQICKNFPELEEKKVESSYDKLPLFDLSESKINEIIASLEFVAASISNQSNKFIKEENVAKLQEVKKSNDQMDKFVQNAITYIKQHINEKISVEELAKYCNYSTSFVSHSFKKYVGMNINTYINKLKIEISKTYLVTSNNTINEISEFVGFDDVSYYSKVFTNLMKISPSEFRRRYKSENKIQL
jgi:AraC-like DNA-binding protein/ligand-binding sensor protein